MIILHINGSTRTIGKSQGFRGLPLRDEMQDTTIGNDVHRVPMMVTAWEPTPDELARLNEGAPVLLHVMGSAHPPVRLEVGECAPVLDPYDGWERVTDVFPLQGRLIRARMADRSVIEAWRHGAMWWNADGSILKQPPTHYKQLGDE